GTPAPISHPTPVALLPRIARRGTYAESITVTSIFEGEQDGTLDSARFDRRPGGHVLRHLRHRLACGYRRLACGRLYRRRHRRPGFDRARDPVLRARHHPRPDTLA